MWILVKIYQLILFILFYLEKFIKANLAVAYDVLTPKHHMKPGIVQIPLNVKKDIGVLMLNNLVTMTPGTICVNIKNDKSTMFVHAMYIANREAIITDIKALEKRIKKLIDDD